MTVPLMMLSQVADWTGGEWRGDDRSLAAVCTDSRAITQHCLFVAIKGDRFDGHAYVDTALQQGAAAALVAHGFASAHDQVVSVADTRKALGQLASGYAQQFDIPKIAVTGNAGKTTVKEMTAALLGQDALATKGNFNNDIGVPLTLLRLRREHQFGVFELGANAPSEIAWTSALVRPDVVMITNVTGAHLEGFGSMQGIANAKAEIFLGCKPGGTAIINGDDSFADFFAAQATAQGLTTVRVSQHAPADIWADNIVTESASVSFMLQPHNLQVQLPMPGRHQVSNALMALAAVAAIAGDLASRVDQLGKLAPVPGRMQIANVAGGTLVDDSYNANPGSVRAAIEWLAAQPAPRCLVLGGLAELGEQGPSIIAELGADAHRAGIDHLLVMPESQSAAAVFPGATVAPDHQAAAEFAKHILEQTGTVLVKGSRSAAMEQVVQRINNNGDSLNKPGVC